MVTARNLYSDRVAVQKLGSPCLAMWGTALDRMLQVREAAEPDRFYDLYYDDLLADPIDAVHRIYAYFGYAVTPGMEEGMRRWLVAHPQHQHGVHQYSLTQFGLDRPTVTRRCAAYISRFHVPIRSVHTIEEHSNGRT